MPDVKSFDEIAKTFDERVRRIVWCTVATVDLAYEGSRVQAVTTGRGAPLRRTTIRPEAHITVDGSTPTASQLAAIRTLDGRADAWVANARRQYIEIGAAVAETLDVAAPQGSTFLFLDVADRLDERGLDGFLSDCADRGLFLAPGPSFGPYPHHVRLCFTAAPPDVTRRGVDVLAELLAG